jgi:LysR family transcriptional regulator, benzoate and cis,cis-muconate-responsive activator of ben and cat genes
MELRHLRYFVTAAEEGSISRAAARLNISQPAVSRQLRDLEEELGVTLFTRTAQGLTVTESGETALIHARDLLRRANTMTATLKRATTKVRKTLHVGFIPTALPGFLADGMRRFNERHAKTCVQIREMSPRRQEEALRAGELDLALLGMACPAIKREFATAPILKAALSLVLPSHHLLALRKSIDLAELEGESFVSLHERLFPGRPQMMADLSEKAGFAIDVGVKADGLSEALGMIAGGAGVAVLPADVDRLPHPGVVFVKMRKPKIYLTSSAAWRKDSAETAVTELVGYLKDAAKHRRSCFERGSIWQQV